MGAGTRSTARSINHRSVDVSSELSFTLPGSGGSLFVFTFGSLFMVRGSWFVPSGPLKADTTYVGVQSLVRRVRLQPDVHEHEHEPRIEKTEG